MEIVTVLVREKTILGSGPKGWNSLEFMALCGGEAKNEPLVKGV